MRVYVLVAALPGWLTTVVAAPAATRGLIGTAAIARMVIAGDISATATFSPAPIAVERFSCCICLNRAVSNERELHRFPTKNPKLNPIEVTGCVGATLSGCVPCPRSFGDISSLAMPRIDLKNDEIDFESIEYPSTEDITWPVTTDGKCGPKWGRICGDSAFGSCCSSYGMFKSERRYSPVVKQLTGNRRMWQLFRSLQRLVRSRPTLVGVQHVLQARRRRHLHHVEPHQRRA